MSTKMLYRLSGLALLIGSSLAFLFEIIRRAVLNSTDVLTVTTLTGLPWLIIHLMILLGAIGIVLVLPCAMFRKKAACSWASTNSRG